MTPAPTVNPDPLLSEKEAAAYRGLSPKTLRNERALGRGPRYIRQGGHIAYRRSDLERYLEACAVDPSAKAEAVQLAKSLTAGVTRRARMSRIREIAAEFQGKSRRRPSDRRSAGKPSAS